MRRPAALAGMGVILLAIGADSATAPDPPHPPAPIATAAPVTMPARESPGALRDPAEIARSFLAEQLGREPDDLVLVKSGTGNVPVAAERVWFGKFLVAGGSTISVYVDQRGVVFGEREYRRRTEEARARLTPFERKADAGLRAFLTTHRPSATTAVSVAIWYASSVATMHAAVIQLGGRPGYATTQAPLLFADVPAGALERLAERGDVNSIGLDAGGWRLAVQ